MKNRVDDETQHKEIAQNVLISVRTLNSYIHQAAAHGLSVRLEITSHHTITATETQRIANVQVFKGLVGQ